MFLYIKIFGGVVNRNSIFSNSFNYYFIPTTCFSPYGPSSGGIYTSQLLGAIYAITDPLLRLCACGPSSDEHCSFLEASSFQVNQLYIYNGSVVAKIAPKTDK
jgi:hypothetical protein